MLMTVASVTLPVGETERIIKNRIEPPKEQHKGKRVCIVTGTHGDELEGQYVAWKLNRRLQEDMQHLHGTVDIYPALNPMGVNTITRGVPGFDLDMNRIFPGDPKGTTTRYLASEIIRDITGADLCIDIHASNIYLKELPQARVNVNTAEKLLPMAKELNLDFIWIHAASTVLESTLACSLNNVGTPTIVVEMGVGMRITEEYGRQLIDGLLNLLNKMGVWDEPVEHVREPIVSSDGSVSFINANASGIFLPHVLHDAMVTEGQELGVIADPSTGEVLEVLNSPVDGLLFTLREYPVVTYGSLIARILGGVER